MKTETKQYLKLLGMECLYMLLLSLAAALTCALQFVGKTFVKTTEGSFFSTTYYRYNSLMLILGIIAFWGAAVFIYKKLIEKTSKIIVTYNIPLRIAAWLVLLIWSFFMFAVLAVTGTLFLGICSKMEPEGFLEIIIFGRPIAAAVLLGADIILKSIRSKK